MTRLFLFLLVAIVTGCDNIQKTTGGTPQPDTAAVSIPVSQSSALEPDRFMAKLEEGIDFLASGNEPFWSLEINFDKSMHFKMADGLEITTPSVQGVKAMDANVIRYAAQTEKGELIVQVQRLECVNDISGEKSPYTVTIDVKSTSDKDYRTYHGCGRYLSDYRIHDIWVLDSMNNRKIQSVDFMKGVPQLELNLTEQKFFGHSGCNNITGTMEVLGKKIQFGRLAGTKMACPNSDFETAYLQALDGKLVPYSVGLGKLYLQVSTDSVFVYRKID